MSRVPLLAARSSLLAFFIIAISASAHADELTVDRTNVRLSESVTITVALEGAFASNDSLNLPVKNLAIDGSPSVSSEFSWINGQVTRRKVFRFSAHPLQAGPAQAGPLVVSGEGGQRETLPAVALQVVPDLANATNEPLQILRELIAADREPMFVVTEADRTSAVVGEEIVVTWVLYNAATVERWQIGSAPKLDAFWSEEIDVRNEQPARVRVGDMEMERVPVRRVALFPLRPGTLQVGGMAVRAQIMRRIEGGPMGFFEGTIEETAFQSAPLPIEVRPLLQPPPDVVGEVVLECTTPLQKGGGPIAFSATLRGRANLRGAAAPRVDGAVDGDLQVEPLPLSVKRTGNGIAMTRRWQYLLSPTRPGRITVPPVAVSIFDPRTSVRGVVRCGGATLQAVAAPLAPPPKGRRPATPQLQWRDLLPWAGALAAVIVALLIAVPRIRHALRARSRSRRLMAGKSATEIRESVHAMLHERGVDVNALAAEQSDRGDVYRAFRSAVDAIERERFGMEEARPELRRRVRDLLEGL